MFWIDKRRRTPSRKQLRSFGLVFAGGFLVIAFWPMFIHHKDPRRWAVMTGIIVGLAAIFVPTILRRLYQVWMLLGDGLGWINSRIILGSLYYVVVTPIRVIMMAVGHDAMNRKLDKTAETYRVLRKPRPASHITHQF